MCQPLTFLDQMLAVVHKAIPDPRTAPVVAYLRGHGYSGFSTDYTIRCLERGMPLGEMYWLRDSDAEALGAMLDADCGCGRCADEAVATVGLLRPSGRAEKWPDDSDLTTEHAF